MTDANGLSPSRQIVKTLAQRYQRQGFTGVAVPAAALLTLDERSQIERLLASMLDAGELVPVGHKGVALHPSARMALLNRAVLATWIDRIARETNPTNRALYRDTVITELRALVQWAASTPLPDDLAQRAAELAGVRTVRTLDPRAMDLVARHGGTPRSRLDVLVTTPPGSFDSVDELLVHLRRKVSSTVRPS